MTWWGNWADWFGVDGGAHTAPTFDDVESTFEEQQLPKVVGSLAGYLCDFSTEHPPSQWAKEATPTPPIPAPHVGAVGDLVWFYNETNAGHVKFPGVICEIDDAGDLADIITDVPRDPPICWHPEIEGYGLMMAYAVPCRRKMAEPWSWTPR